MKAALALFTIGTALAQYNTHPPVPPLSLISESAGFCRVKLLSDVRSSCFVYTSDIAPLKTWQGMYGKHPLGFGVAFTLRVPDGADINNPAYARLVLGNFPWVNKATVITPPWEE